MLPIFSCAFALRMTHTHVPLRMRRRARGAGYAQEEGRGTRGMAARGGGCISCVHGYTDQFIWITHTWLYSPIYVDVYCAYFLCRSKYIHTYVFISHCMNKNHNPPPPSLRAAASTAGTIEPVSRPSPARLSLRLWYAVNVRRRAGKLVSRNCFSPYVRSTRGGRRLHALTNACMAISPSSGERFIPPSLSLVPPSLFPRHDLAFKTRRPRAQLSAQS